MVSTASAAGGGYRTGGFKNRASSMRRGNNQELKYRDYGVAALGIGITWTQIHSTVCAVPIGTGADDRIGRKIFLRSMHIKGHLEFANDNTTGAQTSDNAVRLVVVLDTQCNKAAAAATDIWEPGTSDIVEFRNLEKASRFRVLYDKLHYGNQNIAGTSTTIFSGSYSKYLNINKKLNIPVEADAATGVVGSLTTNNIMVFAVKGGNGVVTYTGETRIRFDG